MAGKQTAAPIPEDEEGRAQLFERMLREARWELTFSQKADPSVTLSEEFRQRFRNVPVTGPVEASLELRVRGRREERLLFREELAKRLQARATEHAEGNTSVNAISDGKDVRTLLNLAAGLADSTGPKVRVSLPERLCERVTVSYLGNQKPALGDEMADWVRAGGLALTSAVAGLMVPSQPKDKTLAGNVEALQYFLRHGRNHKEATNLIDR